MNKSKLDLTVEGHGIKQPRWWTETFLNNGSNSVEPARFASARPGDADECDGGASMFINQHENNANDNSKTSEPVGNESSTVEVKIESGENEDSTKRANTNNLYNLTDGDLNIL